MFLSQNLFNHSLCVFFSERVPTRDLSQRCQGQPQHFIACLLKWYRSWNEMTWKMFVYFLNQLLSISCHYLAEFWHVNTWAQACQPVENKLAEPWALLKNIWEKLLGKPLKNPKQLMQWRTDGFFLVRNPVLFFSLSVCYAAKKKNTYVQYWQL